MTTAFRAIASELLAAGHGVRFRADGGSMYPTIRTGEIITVTPVDPAAIRRGDILLTERLGRIVAHRVTGIAVGLDGARCFTLRGDGATAPDPPVAAAQVFGRVVTVQRRGRHIDLGPRHSYIVRLARKACLRVSRWLGCRLEVARPPTTFL